MGANPTQAMGFVVFLIGMVLVALSFADGGIIFLIGGLVVLAGACSLFLKAKPLEHMDQ